MKIECKNVWKFFGDEPKRTTALQDVNLADKKSFPLADRLKQTQTPYAFATGYGEAGLRAQDRGAIILMKPFRESDLVRVLDEMRDRLKPLGD